MPGWRASPENCDLLGNCNDANGNAVEGKTNVLAGKCDTAAGEVHQAFGVADVGWLAEDRVPTAGAASTPPGWTGATRFPADASGASCFALEGEPKQPTYKLPMCKMYNEKACCAPIHDAETQWAYETLVNVADRYASRIARPGVCCAPRIVECLIGRPQRPCVPTDACST